MTNAAATARVLTDRDRAIIREALETVDLDTLNDNLVAAGVTFTDGTELDLLAARLR